MKHSEIKPSQNQNINSSLNSNTMKNSNLFSSVKNRLFNNSNLTEMDYQENPQKENSKVNLPLNSNKMKTLKNNLVLAAAVFLAVGTMSMKMIEKSVADGWYEVHPNGEDIVGSADAPKPTDDCQTFNTKDLCKIKVSGTQVPTSVSQAYLDGIVIDDAFRLPF